MKLNPSFHPAKAGFHREAISPNAVGFIPSQRTDLVEKATKFCRILSLFLGLPTRIRTADLQSRSLTRYPAVPWVDIIARVIIAHCGVLCKFFFQYYVAEFDNYLPICRYKILLFEKNNERKADFSKKALDNAFSFCYNNERS